MLAPRPGEHVLEIGFGTGLSLKLIAEKMGNRGRLQGIDLSTGMRDVAAERLRQAGLSQQVELVVGDALAMQFRAHSFDAVYMSFTLELFPPEDIPCLLSQCRRILKKTGRLGVVAMQQKERRSCMLRLYEWAHRRFPTLVDCRPIFLIRILEENGYRVLQNSELSMWGLPVTVALATPQQ